MEKSSEDIILLLKKRMKILLFTNICTIILAAIICFAFRDHIIQLNQVLESTPAGYFNYSINKNDINGKESVTITGINDENFSGDLIIPPIIDGIKVRYIEKTAFFYCENLTSITIPNSVISIEEYTFLSCGNLSAINVDNKNSCYSSQDGVLFNKDKTTLICYPEGKTGTSYIIPNDVISIGDNAFDSSHLTSIIIPNSVISIGKRTFQSCNYLKSVTIPSSVTTIGDTAFSLCDDLTSINVDSENYHYSSQNGILFNKNKSKLVCYPKGKSETSYIVPDGVLCIGNYSFAYCENLTSIIMPDTITTIETFAFDSCRNLTSATIPNNVTYIAEYAFASCDRLISLKIPKNVTFIGYRAFGLCQSLTAIDVDNDNNYYSGQNGILFNKDKTILICCPASKAETSYIIPDSVTTIGERAFEHYENLTSITIPNSVTTIGEQAFGICHSLTSVTIPSSVITIGYDAFSHCSRLTSIDVDNKNLNYSGQNGILFNKDKTILIHYPAGKAETSYIIPDSVTTIGRYAFVSCENLTSVTIPISVTTIGKGFVSCKNLTSVTIPNSVTTIENYAFYVCVNLTYVYFEGDAPDTDSSAFGYTNESLIIFYHADKSGWTIPEWNGYPTAIW